MCFLATLLLMAGLQGASAQQPVESDLLKIISPQAGAIQKLKVREQLTVVVKYKNTSKSEVHIIALPYAKGQMGSWMGGGISITAEPKAKGTVKLLLGSPTAQAMDEIKVKMSDKVTNQELAVISVPVQMTWEAPVTKPTPAAAPVLVGEEKNGVFGTDLKKWRGPGKVERINGEDVLVVKLSKSDFSEVRQSLNIDGTKGLRVALDIQASPDYVFNDNCQSISRNVDFRPGGGYKWSALVRPKADFQVRLLKPDGYYYYQLARTVPIGSWAPAGFSTEPSTDPFDVDLHLVFPPGEGSMMIKNIKVQNLGQPVAPAPVPVAANKPPMPAQLPGQPGMLRFELQGYEVSQEVAATLFVSQPAEFDPKAMHSATASLLSARKATLVNLPFIQAFSGTRAIAVPVSDYSLEAQLTLGADKKTVEAVCALRRTSDQSGMVLSVLSQVQGITFLGSLPGSSADTVVLAFSRITQL